MCKGCKIALPKAQITTLKAAVDAKFKQVRAEAAGLKNSLSESGVVGSLLEQIMETQREGARPVGSSFEELLGESWTEAYLARVVDSWQEGLDGVLRVKL